MDYKYDAFISYRHAEKDTKIASEIQQSLERFKIPAALRKQTGKQRFNRVFRDVEELPISSNLTEDLTEALRASEFLIVICSYRTSESDWVKREIDTFLELHDYNKQLVLTVLVEGEPDEVIPEVLRHDNITHYLADGTFYCKDEVVEPLAADYRIPISKARKIELPRLAASMLGCNYDDIIRRRKAYKRTRLLIETAVISAAAIVLMIYIGMMLLKIQDGLRNTQLNQSRYLASESLKLLEDGDRISALQLALAALENTDGSRRPVTSEAEYALAAALGAYTTRGSSVASPIWRYENTSAITKFKCNNSAEKVAILDSAGKIHIYDRKDHKETVLESENKYIDFCYDKDDNLIAATPVGVVSYNAGSLTQKWKYDNIKMSFADKSVIEYYPDKNYLAINGGDIFVMINAANGSKVLELDTEKIKIFVEKRESTNRFFSLFRFSVSPDYSKIALIGIDNAGYNYSLYFYDVSADKWTCPITDAGDFLDSYFDAEGNLMVLYHTKDDNKAKDYAGRDELYDSSVVLELISSNGKSLWKSELYSTMRVLQTKLRSFEYTKKDNTKIPVVVASFANRCVIVDKKNGKTVKSFDLPESAVSSSITTFGTGYAVNMVIRNGLAVWIPLDESTKRITSRKFFASGILDLLIFKDGTGTTSYLAKDASGRIITEYYGRFSDTSFSGFEGSENVGNIVFSTKPKKSVMMISYCDNGKMYGLDIKDHKLAWEANLPAKSSIFSFNAFSSDNKFEFIYKETQDEKGALHGSLIKINRATGEIEPCNKDFQIKNAIDVDFANGRIIAIADPEKDHKELTVYMYELSSDSVKKFTVDIRDDNAYSYPDLFKISPDGKKAIAYIKTKENDDSKTIRLMIDLDSGKADKQPCTTSRITVWNEKSTLFAEAASDGKIAVFSPDGKKRYTIDNETLIPRGMSFFEEKLYVCYNIDILCSYDGKGRQVLNVALEHGDLEEDTKVRFEKIKGLLFVSAGDYTDIIDTISKKSISSFSGMLCLHNLEAGEKDISQITIVSRTFVTGEGAIVGSFEYKTVEKMIRQAKEYLNANGVTMSNEFKRRYGLE